jgi:hypothetical protein
LTKKSEDVILNTDSSLLAVKKGEKNEQKRKKQKLNDAADYTELSGHGVSHVVPQQKGAFKSVQRSQRHELSRRGGLGSDHAGKRHLHVDEK